MGLCLILATGLEDTLTATIATERTETSTLRLFQMTVKHEKLNIYTMILHKDININILNVNLKGGLEAVLCHIRTIQENILLGQMR